MTSSGSGWMQRSSTSKAASRYDCMTAAPCTHSHVVKVALEL